jgi:hypothetical protein
MQSSRCRVFLTPVQTSAALCRSETTFSGAHGRGDVSDYWMEDSSHCEWGSHHTRLPNIDGRSTHNIAGAFECLLTTAPRPRHHTPLRVRTCCGRPWKSTTSAECELTACCGNFQRLQMQFPCTRRDRGHPRCPMLLRRQHAGSVNP